MKTLGLVLLVIGTIVASLGGAKLPTASLAVSGAGLVILAIALLCLRWPERADGKRSAGAGEDLRALLARLPARVGELAAEAETLELGALPARIDAISVELLAPIAEGAPKLLRELGAARFAEVFSAFASSERALARAWSAAADGHAPEAHASLARAVSRAEAAASSLAR